MSVLVVLLAVVVALLAVLVTGLLRSHAEILRALHELGAGLDPAEPGRSGIAVPRARTDTRMGTDLAGTSPEGDAVAIAVVGVEHPTLLAFLTSGCTTCVEFWNAFADSRALRVPGDARLVVVTKGAEAESPDRLRKFSPRDVPVVMTSEAWEAYDVQVAPYFAYVDGPTGAVVGEGAASTWGHLQDILTQALADAGVEWRGSRRARGGANGRAREAHADAQLLAAGIEPGHPSLFPTASTPNMTRSGRQPRHMTTTQITACGVLVAVVAAIRSSWSP